MSQSSLQTIITPRQLSVLLQIEAFQTSHCYSATIGDLADALNLSRTTVFEHIAALCEKKLITKSNGKARSLQLTTKGRQLIAEARRLESLAVASPKTASKPENTPWTVVGRISAGYGIEALPDPQPFSSESFLGCERGEFLLQVVGTSMVDAGILDGDYIVCRPSATAIDGQIVVALLNGQNVTVKRFFKDQKAVRLQPANDAFEPIFAKDCIVQAVVTGVIRKLPIR
jgi:repressor LexA